MSHAASWVIFVQLGTCVCQHRPRIFFESCKRFLGCATLRVFLATLRDFLATSAPATFGKVASETA